MAATNNNKKTDKKTALYTELCELFAPNDEVVKKHVLLAVTDPEAAAETIQKWDDAWSPGETTDNLAWVTLATSLVVRKRAFAIDYRASSIDAMRGFATILPKLGHDPKKLLAWYDKSYEHLSAGKIITKCGEAFSAFRLALVWLDVSSGIFQVTVIPHAKLAAAQTLGRRAQERIVSYWPKLPLKKPLDRAATTPAAKKAPLAAKRVVPKKLALRGSHEVRETLPSRPALNVKHRATLFDLTSWPPKKIEVAPFSAQSIAWHHENGDMLVAGFSPKKSAKDEDTEQLLFKSGNGKATHDLTPSLPKNVRVERVTFVGDVGVIFPDEPTYLGDRKITGPLILEAGAKKLSSPKGLPPIKVSTKNTFTFEGSARTGSGLDVLIWGGGGFVRDPKTKRFERWCDLGGRANDSRPSTVPADGDAFFVTVNETVYEIRHGKKPTRRLAKLDERVDAISKGEGNTVLVGFFLAHVRAPACAVWWPTEREYRLVPSTLLALARGHFIERVGYDAKTKLLWWVADYQFFTLPWSATESLPRFSEDTGRRL